MGGMTAYAVWGAVEKYARLASVVEIMRSIEQPQRFLPGQQADDLVALALRAEPL